MELHIADFDPFNKSAGDKADLPNFLAIKHCILNVHNEDMRCFGYSILSSMFPIEHARHPERPSHYDHLFSWRGLDKLHYPVSIADIPEIEKKLEVNINVFSFNDDVGQARYAMYLSKTNFEHTVDLLYWNGHYAQISHFNRFMSDISAHHSRKYFCKRCLGHFYSELDLVSHRENCTATEGHKQVLELPDKDILLKFKNFRYVQHVPFVIYADFECLLKPTNKKRTTPFEYQEHLPYSVGLKLITTVPELCNIPFKSYTGP